MHYKVKPKEKLCCDNILCLYWRDDHCTLDGIFIDSLGICGECFFLEFDRETIEKTRREMLEHHEDFVR